MKKRYVWFEDLDGVICCPSCCNRIDIFYKMSFPSDEVESFEPDFCPYCGQALDWSETRRYGVNEKH